MEESISRRNFLKTVPAALAATFLPPDPQPLPQQGIKFDEGERRFDGYTYLYGLLDMINRTRIEAGLHTIFVFDEHKRVVEIPLRQKGESDIQA